jgi:hypothetical protein
MRRQWLVVVLVLGAAVGCLFAIRLAVDGTAGEAAVPANHDRVVDGVVSQIDQRQRSDFQDELLRDGYLSEEEYDLAFEKYSACVVGAGGELNGPGTKTRWGVYDFWVGVPPVPSGGPDREAQARVADCSATYWDVVGPRWSAMRMVPREEFVDAFGSVPGCMRDSGVEPPEDVATGWGSRYLETASREDGTVFMECVRAANRAIGMPSNLLSLP